MQINSAATMSSFCETATSDKNDTAKSPMSTPSPSHPPRIYSAMAHLQRENHSKPEKLARRLAELSLRRWIVTHTMMQRLGKNNGAYFGESIDVIPLLSEVRELGTRHGWAVDLIPAGNELKILALRRTVPRPAQRIYISAGIHGDEPAGPLAVRELLARNNWPDCADIWICPCLNPTGFQLNKRESAHGADLN